MTSFSKDFSSEVKLFIYGCIYVAFYVLQGYFERGSHKKAWNQGKKGWSNLCKIIIYVKNKTNYIGLYN